MTVEMLLHSLFLGMRHALRVHAGEVLAEEIIDSLLTHLDLERQPEPPGGFLAQRLLSNWRMPT